MKDTKTELRFYSIPEWKKEEIYLRKQHKNGWKFNKIIFPGFYHFEKCEPEDVVYQLDYNQDGISHKEEYVKMFKDCGWEYIQDFVGYSYFRKPVSEMDGNGNEEIFCDDASRADMMKRVFCGRMIPMFNILFLIIIPQIYMQSHHNTPINHVLAVFFISMFVLYIIIFISFGLSFLKYWKKVHK